MAPAPTLAAGWEGPLEAGLPAGLMQDVPLTLDLVLRRLETVGSQVSVT
jgi:hypothetical protein